MKICKGKNRHDQPCLSPPRVPGMRAAPWPSSPLRHVPSLPPSLLPSDHEPRHEELAAPHQSPVTSPVQAKKNSWRDLDPIDQTSPGRLRRDEHEVLPPVVPPFFAPLFRRSPRPSPPSRRPPPPTLSPQNMTTETKSGAGKRPSRDNAEKHYGTRSSCFFPRGRCKKEGSRVTGSERRRRRNMEKAGGARWVRVAP